MALKGRVARLAWAAIVVIAAQLAIAGSAFAHSGHAHHAPVAATISTDQPSATAHATAKAETLQPERSASSLPANFASAPENTSADCIGGCCANGISCCGAVLPDASGALPDRKDQAQLVSTAFAARSGTDPDTLARPPKTLA